MKKKLIVVLILAIFLALSCGVSFADRDSCSGGCGQPRSQYEKMQNNVEEKAYLLFKNKERLGLSDKQLEGIKDLKLKVKKDLIKMEAEIEILELDIEAATYSDVTELEAINAHIEEKYELKKVKAKYLIAAYAELKGILTEEQKAKLKDIYKSDK
ncbi:MAG: Spy/CpxP family protein refolding chaperone [Candidatus Omnitrophota bacterium]|nr:hypothetical protein [Candidatus Omnitrophota bacterium]